MGVVVHENEVTSKIPAAKFMQVFFVDAHIHMPKILPNIIKSVDFIEGNGGSGSVGKTTFTEESGYKYLTNKVDVVDKENLVYGYTSIAGDPWFDGLEKVSHESKFSALPDGGSVCKSTIKYYPQEGKELDIAKLKDAEEKSIAMFKVVEAHILANPDAY